MDLIAARLTSQRLSRPMGTAGEVIGHLVGLQAQDEWIAPYAIRPRARRSEPPPDAVVNWLMRGTLHLVRAGDARWLTALLGPVFAARTAPRRRRLGLTEAMLAKAVPALVDRLPATRDELVAEAARMGVPEGQARAHTLAYAGMTGAMCLSGKHFTPIPAGIAPADPAAELVRRYLVGFGPARAEDFAAWSGLPLATARRAFDGVDPPEVTQQPVPRVRLLGHLDPYLLGYKDRSFALDPQHAKKVQRGGGFLQPVVLVDGRVTGIWSRAWKARHVVITVEAFGDIPAGGLAAEVNDLGRFLGVEATLA